MSSLTVKFCKRIRLLVVFRGKRGGNKRKKINKDLCIKYVKGKFIDFYLCLLFKDFINFKYYGKCKVYLNCKVNISTVLGV